MAGLETILALAGTATSAIGTIAAGSAAQADAEFQAKQLEAKGQEEFAASQREAAEKRKDARLLLSRSQALAAASGAGTGGSVLENEQDIAGEGELQALSSLYAGESRKRGLYDQAAASRRSGKAAKMGSYFKAGGTLLSGAGSAYSDWRDRYG